MCCAPIQLVLAEICAPCAHNPNNSWQGSGRYAPIILPTSLRHSVQLRGVAADDGEHLVFGHAFEDARDDFLAVRERAFGVRVVTRPEERPDARDLAGEQRRTIGAESDGALGFRLVAG